MTLDGCHLRWRNHYSVIASRVVVVSEVVAELAFRMKLPGIHDVDLSALHPNELFTDRDNTANISNGSSGSNSSQHATGEKVTADVNGTATDDEGRSNPTGSLQFDIMCHESTSMKLKHNKRIGTRIVRSLYAEKLKVITGEAKRCKLDILDYANTDGQDKDTSHHNMGASVCS